MESAGKIRSHLSIPSAPSVNMNDQVELNVFSMGREAGVVLAAAYLP